MSEFSENLDTLNRIINELRAENARLLKATTPICVGRGVIGYMAKDGIWTSENGASVVAADELFRNNPYEEIARLREALKPFAEAADDEMACLRMSDLRAARKALGDSDE